MSILERLRLALQPQSGPSTRRAPAVAGTQPSEVGAAQPMLLEDGEGYGVMVALSPAAARLLGLRLTQAYQAVQPAKVA